MNITTGKRILAAGTTILALTVPFTQIPDARTVSAKMRPKKVTLLTGNTYRIKRTGIRGKIKWSSSNKRIAKVNRRGLVTAKKAGSATITAKVKQTKYKWRIKVKKRHKKPTPVITPPLTQQPSQTAKPMPTSDPSDSAVTEQTAYAVLNSLRSTYPERMPLTNSYYYYSPKFGNGYGCYGFAAKLSDTVFGTDTPYQIHRSFDRIKVGDHVRIGSSHSVVVLTKNERDITVVEGNYNSAVHWDRKITAASLTSSGFKVYTRY